MARIEDEHPDVLENMELGIMMAWKDHPDMSDHDVMWAIEALIDAYAAEKIGRAPRKLPRTDTERDILTHVRHFADWRMGRGQLSGEPQVSLVSEGSGPPVRATRDEITPAPVTLDIVVQCLKRILKSVQRWNREGGRQGYLNFVSQFVK